MHVANIPSILTPSKRGCALPRVVCPDSCSPPTLAPSLEGFSLVHKSGLCYKESYIVFSLVASVLGLDLHDTIKQNFGAADLASKIFHLAGGEPEAQEGW